MSFCVRPMCPEDTPQVKEIDGESFLSTWVQTDFKNELKNPLAHYIVVGDEKIEVLTPEVKVTPTSVPGGLLSKVIGFLKHRAEPIPQARQYIFGFAGFWTMADEAHITTLAVRGQHRRKGIGELLLISIIDLARNLDARILTLEVRISNTPAQSLYSKYGFKHVGLRHAYYTDNEEDGVKMSTEDINSASFKQRLGKLKQNYSKRYRIPVFNLKGVNPFSSPTGIHSARKT